ncbi:MAG: hypothetical protein ACTSQ7_05485 [Alphaproteobacteria bacterium]
MGADKDRRRAKRGGDYSVHCGGILGVALLAAVLAGCESLPQQPATVFETQTAQPESEPKASEATTTPPQPEAQTGPKTAALPPEPMIDDDPARVLGLGLDKLTELLGQPELTRREPPAEIWQYRGETCVFDVFLYEEAGSVRVTYLEARDESAQRIAERNCLNQLLRARLTRPLG